MAFRTVVCLVSIALLLLLWLFFEAKGGSQILKLSPRMLTKKDEPKDDPKEASMRWAVLDAGSSSFVNYRHQVKERTFNNGSLFSSHVMEYGSKDIKAPEFYLFQSFDPATLKFAYKDYGVYKGMLAVPQKDAGLFFLFSMYKTSEKGSEKRQILEEIATKVTKLRVLYGLYMDLDASVKLIGMFLYGPQGSFILDIVRGPEMALVDDWECLKSTIRLFERYCGSLRHAMKYTRAFGNICNSGVS